MSNLTEEFYTLKNNIDLLEKEIQQLSAGRKASASRSRKCLQNIKQQSFNMRKSITSHVKGLPVNKRTKAEPVEPVEPEQEVKAEPEVKIEEEVIIIEKPKKHRPARGLIMKKTPIKF